MVMHVYVLFQSITTTVPYAHDIYFAVEKFDSMTNTHAPG